MRARGNENKGENIPGQDRIGVGRSCVRTGSDTQTRSRRKSSNINSKDLEYTGVVLIY